MRPVLYGIPNCDTVRKARALLDSLGLHHDFHDYRKAGIDAALLESWIEEFGWEKVLNRAGTTFRKLPDSEKHGLDATKAAALMRAHPSMIRRPIVEADGRRLIGFVEPEWREALA